MKPLALLLACALLTLLPLRAATPPLPGDLATPLETSSLDPAAFSEWADGAEKPILPLRPGDKERVPQWVLWTRTTQPGHSGIAFGDSKNPGIRHLRIGFTTPVPIGSVIVKGGGQLSILKPDAAYPGDLANEAM